MTAPDPEYRPRESPGGFFSRLFDFSFDTFITTSVIRVLYVLVVVLAGLGAVAVFLGIAARGGAAFVLGLIVAPILFLVYVLLARIWLEVLIVVFRIAEDANEIARSLRERPLR